MNRAALLAALAVLATLGACRQPESPGAPAPGPAPAVIAAPTQVPAPAPPLDLTTPGLTADAFRAAWGAPWPLHRKISNRSEPGVLTYEEASLVPLGGDRYALISSGSLEDAAHIDSGALSIHYLKHTRAGFERTGGWPEFIWDGTFGNAPSWDARTDIATDPAILVSAGGTWQGYTCEWTTLIELTPQAPVIRTETIPTGYDSGGASEDPKGARTMSATVVADQKGRSFVVRYSGDKTVSVPYALTGNRYVAQTRPALLTC